jgi:Bacteriophage baseplate protein W
MVDSHLDHPLRLDGRGRVATTETDDHVRDMVYQVLFTNPGERVNHPDFGCGLLQLVFEPNSDVLATATQFLVHGSLQRWLADVIQVDRVEITNEEEQLIILVVYTRLDTGQRRQDLFVSPVGGL